MDAHLLGQFIGAIGRPVFEDHYRGLAAHTLDAAACSAFTFDEAGQPHSIVCNCKFPTPLWTRLAEVGEDAILVHGVRPQAPGDLRAVTADEHFSDVVVQCRHNGKRYDLSFHRRTDGPGFDSATLNIVRSLSEIVVPAMELHLALINWAPAEVEDELPIVETLDHLISVLLAEENRLSPREAEICAAVVLGYRTLAISINCGISENTVRTHRKRAYAKLGITSQNELFSRYFRIVAGIGGAAKDGMPFEMRKFTGIRHQVTEGLASQSACV